jgi:hypothetical protein
MTKKTTGIIHRIRRATKIVSAPVRVPLKAVIQVAIEILPIKNVSALDVTGMYNVDGILRTTDGGATWRRVTLPVVPDLRLSPAA